ncbi:hypothetical protein B7486_19620 [cyanobacterium TDX16]|nr:hypothetical protein B7486_19620 [cyanobacterium TDX16]
MKHRYLEVTFRRGRPLAAYLFLDRKPGDTSARTEKRDKGLVVDFAGDGRAIGVEITSPTVSSLEDINQVLNSLHEKPLTAEDVRPLAAA